jgi:hypothetical protein
MLQNKKKKKIISRRLRWAGRVAPVEERRRGYRVLVGKPREERLENLGVGGGIILKWIFEKWMRWHGLDQSGTG